MRLVNAQVGHFLVIEKGADQKGAVLDIVSPSRFARAGNGVRERCPILDHRIVAQSR
jgi:hypothetical protein